MAEEEKSETEKKDSDRKDAGSKSFGIGAVIGIAIVACVIGACIGKFALGGGASSGAAIGKSALEESELDNVLATYVYDGQTHEVTAREVYTQFGSLDSVANEDGKYPVPAVSDTLNYVQYQIVLKKAEAEGIEVSDDDVTAAAQEQYGSDDWDAITSSQGQTEDELKEAIRNNLLITKLRDKVQADGSDGNTSLEYPEQPTAPEVEYPEAPNQDDFDNDDDYNAAMDKYQDEYDKVTKKSNETTSKEYAEYIIGLAGDEWDADKGTWKDESGQYATALADYEIKKDSASYAAANEAWNVAYQQYSAAQSSMDQKWTDYMYDILYNGSISFRQLA